MFQWRMINYLSRRHISIFLNISLTLEKRDISGPRNEIKFGKRSSQRPIDSALTPDERGGSPLLELFNGSLVGGSPVKRYVCGVGHISVKPLTFGQIRAIGRPRIEIKFGKRSSQRPIDSALIPDERGGSLLLELFNGLLVGRSPVKRQSAQAVDFPEKIDPSWESENVN